MSGSHAPPRDLAAVVFDVDGTLYRLRPVRLAMAAELLVGSLTRGPRLLRTIRAYRAAHEELRRDAVSRDDLRDEQVRRAAAATGQAPEVVATVVARWMERRPLRYLRIARRRGHRGC